jgi:hypothetical protein
MIVLRNRNVKNSRWRNFTTFSLRSRYSRSSAGPFRHDLARRQWKPNIRWFVFNFTYEAMGCNLLMKARMGHRDILQTSPGEICRSISAESLPRTEPSNLRKAQKYSWNCPGTIENRPDSSFGAGPIRSVGRSVVAVYLQAALQSPPTKKQALYRHGSYNRIVDSIFDPTKRQNWHCTAPAAPSSARKHSQGAYSKNQRPPVGSIMYELRLVVTLPQNAAS